MKALQIHHLTKSFGGVHAVDHVDLSFDSGKITGIIGPNGSGKTTLINTITGLHPMDSGSVMVGDAAPRIQLRSSDIASLGITRTFQRVRLIEQLSVLDNMFLVLTKRSVWSALRERDVSAHVATAENILTKVGLWEKRNERAESLSYGQRNLLEIARAVAMNSRVYFLDEPFAGLFPEMTKIVADILRELKEGGAAVILVEHDMSLIRSLADHCYVLDTGRVIAEGSPSDVLLNEDVIEAYLGR